ncbi:MAG: class I SAM-dependent methyltransferase, partial [Cyanobacteria bacterium J06659_2]
KPEGIFISVTPCLRQKMSLLVNLQIQLVRVLCKLGLIPIPIRRITSSEVDDLLETGGFQTVESEEIYRGASSYFVVAKKLQKT